MSLMYIMDKVRLGLGIGVILLLVVLICLVVVSKNKKKSKYSDITDTTDVALEEQGLNLKSTYKIKFTVKNASSTKKLVTLMDRKSPLVVLDMATGQIGVRYYTSPASIVRSNIISIRNPEPETPEDEPEDDEVLIQEGCTCPTLEVEEKKEATGVKEKLNKVPKVMRVVTPSISFQKPNTVEIRQNLRAIDIFLNGEFFHSAMLDYVPYLAHGSASLLPNDAHKSVTINSFEFKNKVVE